MLVGARGRVVFGLPVRTARFSRSGGARTIMLCWAETSEEEMALGQDRRGFAFGPGRPLRHASQDQAFMRQDIEEVGQTYGIEKWGAGYFSINPEGHLLVHPERGRPGADVYNLVDKLVRERKLSTPLLLRFPQVLGTQLKRLCLAYEAASREAGYRGEHLPVFPMKVNPRREVVSEFLREGEIGRAHV